MAHNKNKNSLLLQTPQQAARFSENELEMMKRRLENESPESIVLHMGISQSEYASATASSAWQTELALQASLKDRNIRARMETLSTEALDVVRDIMRTAASATYRLRAALELLDRAGYVKVEKRINITADAETVIRELNKLGTQSATLTVDADGEVPEDALQRTDEVTEAVLVAIEEERNG